MGKNILAVVLGIVLGGCVNMGVLIGGMKLVPPPDGVDVMNPENLKANIHKFEAKHFAVPFLAHALGTLVGAFVAAKMAASHPFQLAMGVGAFFTLGGLYNAFAIPGPTWFAALDLIAAYFPMAWIGYKLAGEKPAAS